VKQILQFAAACACLCLPIHAQWQPNGATSGNIYYNNGYVGVGTSNVLAPLSVGGQMVIGFPWRGDASLHITSALGGFGRLTQIHPHDSGQNAVNLMASIDTAGNANWWVWGVNNNVWTIQPGTEFGGSGGLHVAPNGNVGIGSASPPYRLTVDGTIGTREVVVTTTPWSDYVFQPGYRLRPLSEVNAFIQANHHLPEIPSEAEVKQKGVSVGEMQAKLLAKIEELTLHMIRQEKEIADLRTKLAVVAKQGN